MKTKYTEGNWVVGDKALSEYPIFANPEKHIHCVAIAFTPGNACLVAAAPELLRTAKLAQYHLERFTELMPKAYHLDDMESLNTAIVKAEGKQNTTPIKEI